MFENIENIQLLSCCLGISPAYKRVTIRKTNVLVLWLTGPVEYDFGDQQTVVSGGEMLFIPQGTSYTIRSPERVAHRGIYLWFSGEIKNRKPKGYPMENFSEAGEVCAGLVSKWLSGNEAERLKCIGLFYGILSHIAAMESADYATRKKYRIIEPAVSYLKEHIFDSDLRTDRLHELCGISGTYFRKIFLSEFGTSPQKYIINKRLSCAKSILDSGDFTTVTEVAAAVGYTDPLYFSQSFRQKYGFPPSRHLDPPL